MTRELSAVTWLTGRGLNHRVPLSDTVPPPKPGTLGDAAREVVVARLWTSSPDRGLQNYVY